MKDFYRSPLTRQGFRLSEGYGDTSSRQDFSLLTSNGSLLMRSGIALGSNMGDRVENLREAFQRVVALNAPSARILFSSIYETSPVASQPGTPFYLNAVMEIDFQEAPIALLRRVLEIEQTMGRPSKRPRNASRLIDLDILYVGDLVLSDTSITIPHPRLTERRFVLAPLAEVAPDLVLPGQDVSVEELLARLADPGTAVPIASTLNGHEQDNTRFDP